MSLKRPTRFTDIELRESESYKSHKKKLNSNGEYTQDDSLSGLAVSLESSNSIELSNGAVYFGQTNKGKMHGKGKIVLPSGDVYIGYFEDGQKHGRGYLKRRDGNFEEVEFLHDVRVHSYNPALSESYFREEDETKAFYGGNDTFYHKESEVDLSSKGRPSFNSKLYNKLNSTADEEGNDFRSRLNKKLRRKRCFKQLDAPIFGKENNLPKQRVKASFLINQEWSEGIEEGQTTESKNDLLASEKYLSIIEPTNVDSFRLTESEIKGGIGYESSNSQEDSNFLHIKPKMITSEAVEINQSNLLNSHLHHNGLGYDNSVTKKGKQNFGEIMEFISHQKAYFYPETHIEIKNKSALKYICPYEIEDIDSSEDQTGRDTFDWDFLK